MPHDFDDPRWQWATFGRQIEIFTQRDPIGQYITKWAQSVQDAAIAEFKKTDLTQPDGLMKALRLQNRMDFPSQWIALLLEAMAAGQAAADQLDEEHRGSSSE